LRDADSEQEHDHEADRQPERRRETNDLELGQQKQDHRYGDRKHREILRLGPGHKVA
jgi:hypothetical protein